jgi:hypothetical protein
MESELSQHHQVNDNAVLWNMPTFEQLEAVPAEVVGSSSSNSAAVQLLVMS